MKSATFILLSLPVFFCTQELYQRCGKEQTFEATFVAGLSGLSLLWALYFVV
jgi:hypothetical protein